jgi:hypothetical protein
MDMMIEFATNAATIVSKIACLPFWRRLPAPSHGALAMQQ